MCWLYTEQLMKFYLYLLPISSSLPCQASCVNSKPTVVHAAHAVPVTLLESWDFFLVISKFNCWWGMFILLRKFAEPWILERSWVMTDHISFEWAFTSYKQVFSCKQFSEFFSRQLRDVRSSSLHTTAVKHFWIYLLMTDFDFYWQLIMC